MKTKPPFDGEIHAVSAKNMPDLNSPKREPGWFLGGPTPDPTPTRDEAVPTGWKLVPIEPTPKMLQDAAFNLSDEFGADFVKPLGDFARSLWAELLASAPAPASGGVDVEALTYRVANAKLGEGDSVRCEGPTDFEKDQARAWVKRVLRAQAYPSPAASPASPSGVREKLEWIKNTTMEPWTRKSCEDALAALASDATPAATSPASFSNRRTPHDQP